MAQEQVSVDTAPHSTHSIPYGRYIQRLQTNCEYNIIHYSEYQSETLLLTLVWVNEQQYSSTVVANT